MLTDVLYIVLALFLLFFGAQWLVTGSAKLAEAYGIPQLIIGLTIVAFGTSSPELIVTITASSQGQTGMAIGNVVGSNIMNILLILGLTAVVSPVFVEKKIIRSDIPLLIVFSSLLIWILINPELKSWEGFILLGCLLLYAGWMFFNIRKKRQLLKADGGGKSATHFSKKQKYFFVFQVFVGLGLLTAGSRLLVLGAVDIARLMNVSETIIGLTVVSIGTGLPELGTSAIAAMRKQSDIAVGNIVGSNIFNILVIAGISISAYPAADSGISLIDLLFMIGAAVLLFPLAYYGSAIRRAEGALLLGLYVLYLFIIWP
ncbi:MAG: calcium/sodium antiporter [Bacteroidales bacterium]|nr:calcium/sodium antiporter [Bacteroidales bacterium]